MKKETILLLAVIAVIAFIVLKKDKAQGIPTTGSNDEPGGEPTPLPVINTPTAGIKTSVPGIDTPFILPVETPVYVKPVLVAESYPNQYIYN